MSRTQKLLFFLAAWLICLMPFLFWWNTWFGRKLSDQQLTEYLHDTKKPRHIQQALVQVGERITHQRLEHHIGERGERHFRLRQRRAAWRPVRLVHRLRHPVA